MRRLALVVAAVLAAGCGSGAHARPSATLVLDFTPNPVHTGIYAALARGYDAQAGVQLEVIAPPSSPDSIKLLQTGRVRFAILDIHDLAIARERGAKLVGIMAIVQRPLAAVIAQPQISTPRQLQGQTVGVTGVPSDTAVLHSIVSGAGGAVGTVHQITIGFNAVPYLLARRVAAATAFWNDEGVALRRQRRGIHVFQVDQYGAPRYPELVLCATAQTVAAHPGLARAVVQAVRRGYEFTESNPSTAAAELESRVPGLDPKLVTAELAVELPAFKDASGRVGVLDEAVLRVWSSWEARFGIVSRRPDVARMFDLAFAPPSA